MAASGAKVLMLRSVELARNHNVKLHVRSTFSTEEGTWVTEEDERMLEKAMISGVTHTLEETLYRVEGVPAARLFAALAEASVNVDTILQTSSEIVFSAPDADHEDAARVLDGLGAPWSGRYDLGKVSVVGAGMKSHPGIAAKTFSILGARDRARRRVHLADQDRLPHPARRRRARGPGAARGIRPGHRRPGTRPVKDARIGVVGATGAVGTITLELLRERGYADVRAFASARSAGRRLGGLTVEEATPEALSAGDLDLCLFSVGTSASLELVPHAVRGGAVCVDKSAAYRLVDGVPLVVPEVNGARAAEHQGIVANPNCCAIPLTCTLKPLHDAAGLRRVVVSTYQSVSGAGAQAMERLRSEPPDSHDLRMDWSFDGVEFDEESKLREETRKILELPELPVSATCVRVPVMVGHAEAVWLETEDPLSPEHATELLAAAPGIRLEQFPTPGGAAGATTCSSAGSGATRPPRTASCSSSPATTCARARPSTRSRSPSCSSRPWPAGLPGRRSRPPGAPDAAGLQDARARHTGRTRMYCPARRARASFASGAPGTRGARRR